MDNIELWCGDCLELMNNIPDKSVDMILCDLPYGTTKNKWDSTINLELLWKQYKRIIKQRGCIALFAQTPFDKVLGSSNLEMLKYEWIWEKAYATGFLNAKKMPLKKHENILIFYNKLPTYNPQGLIYNPKIQKRGGVHLVLIMEKQRFKIMPNLKIIRQTSYNISTTKINFILLKNLFHYLNT